MTWIKLSLLLVLLAALLSAAAANAASIPSVLWPMLPPENTFQPPVDPEVPGAFQVEVGEEEYVMGPVSSPIDSFYFGAPIAGGVRTYSANGNTITYSGPNLDSLIAGGTALSKGTKGNFDECGVWLQSIHKLDENHWIGWYHAEEKCNHSIGLTHKSMAFAESFDAGKTWSKPNYPKNQVLTADTAFAGDTGKDDVGEGTVTRIGDYFYLFFRSSEDWKTHVARSSVADLGRPGTWYKYYNGAFSEPGIGGKSSFIDKLLSSSVSYNSYLNRYMAVNVSARWGFSLSLSVGPDILNWELYPNNSLKQIYPRVTSFSDPLANQWLNRDANSRQVYAYGSFVAPDANGSAIGQQFYLYYLKLFSGENFSQRYLMRRKIVLKPFDNTVYAKVALVRYAKANPTETKVSTEIAKPKEGYQKKQILGYLLPYEKAGYQALYDCFNPANNDYFLSIADPSLLSWQHCESTKDVFIRRIGWVSATQTAFASTPLYRCYDAPKKDHFASTDSRCEGKTTKSLVGYIFPN